MVNTKLTIAQREMLIKCLEHDHVVCHDTYKPMRALQKHGFISIKLTDTNDVYCSLMKSGSLWLNYNGFGGK